MIKTFSLNHLDDTEFEEFCYDLLNELGFKNVQWRKGTGLSASPADKGRDIECINEIADIDGHKYSERWFVQCKHYQKGVPPEKLQGVLTWATAERPEKVLVIASNFLSNPAKDFLASYQDKNRPPFRIKVWEKPDIEKLSFGKLRLIQKYQIPSELSFASSLHPGHILYIKGPKFNTLETLFKATDKLDQDQRDPLLSWAYDAIIRPRYRQSVTGKEKLRDLRIDEVSYDAFKKKCYAIVKGDSIDEYMLVFLVVSLLLNCLCQASEGGSAEEVRKNIDGFQEFIAERHKDEDDFDEFNQFLNSMKENAETNIERSKQYYIHFCETVVSILLLEDLI